MVPSIRSRRVVSNGGPHLSVADDVIWFITFSAFYKLCSIDTLTRRSMLPSSRSRRKVSHGGPHLSVAYDLTCFMKVFALV